MRDDERQQLGDEGPAPAQGTPEPRESRQPTILKVDGSTVLILRIEQTPPIQAPDELVASPFGLEEAAAARLVHERILPAAKIGRRTYARRSDILALVDKLRKEDEEKEAKPESTGDALADYEAMIAPRSPFRNR